LPLLYVLIFSMGFGLMLSSVTVFFRDVKHLYSVVLMLLMYTSAIFYPANIIPSKYQVVIKCNPLFGVIEMARDVLMYQKIPSFQDHLFIFLYAIMCFMFGLFVFHRTQDKFILRI
jgi:ABC-type polysaccharide/polyol phosphate export permease